MLSPRTGSPRRPGRRRWSLAAGAAVLGLIPATGCQVEYAGMTLPSGKYMRDDVQYFAPGPDFPWANTQAATQRARMSSMGMVAPPAPGTYGLQPLSPNAVANPAPNVPIGPGFGGAAPGNAPPVEGEAVPNPNPVQLPGAGVRPPAGAPANAVQPLQPPPPGTVPPPM